MNEILYITIALVALSATIIAARRGYEYLLVFGVFVGLATSIFAGKVVSVFGLEVSAATALFGALFLITDVTAEVHGRKAALRIVWTTFVANLFFLALGFAIVAIDAGQPTPVAGALTDIFAFLPRLLLGGLTAFVVAQSLDVYIFSKMRQATKGKHLWLRNNLSTAVSQFVDTSIVWFIAFYGIIPDLWPIIFANYAVKIVTAGLDTPFCYLAVRLAKKNSNND